MHSVSKRVLFHRDLPPLRAEQAGEHWIVASSDAVAYHYAERDHLWARCTASLESNLVQRLEQEIDRLAGTHAHILEERVVPKIDHAQNLYWLEGKYDYVLYRAPSESG